MKLISLFPTIIQPSLFNEISDKQLNTISEIASKESYQSRGQGNTDTSIDEQILEKKELKFLKNLILKQFYQLKNEVLGFPNTEFTIHTSWFTKTEPDTQGVYHTHRCQYYTGCFYFNKEKSSGIRFIDFHHRPDVPFLGEPEELNMYNTHQFRYEIEPRLNLLFPATTIHKIEYNDTNDTRYSLSYNFLPIINKGID